MSPAHCTFLCVITMMWIAECIIRAYLRCFSYVAQPEVNIVLTLERKLHDLGLGELGGLEGSPMELDSPESFNRPPTNSDAPCTSTNIDFYHLGIMEP